ncbi:MAG: hypothetical protein QOE63_283 [Acidimicrobiaceae bacterium]|jgi:plastocyanin
MNSTLRHACRVVLAALLVTVIVGCGSGSAETSSVASSSGPAGDTVVRMVPPGRYSPAKIQITAGSKVTWQDTGTGERHNVVFVEPGGQGVEDARMSSHRDAIAVNATFEARFTAPGDYSYVCTFHEMEGMVGTVTVV